MEVVSRAGDALVMRKRVTVRKSEVKQINQGEAMKSKTYNSKRKAGSLNVEVKAAGKASISGGIKTKLRAASAILAITAAAGFGITASLP